MKKVSGPGSSSRRDERKAAKARGSAVKILAGRWKGRRLEIPAGARPTSSRAREALFDILQCRVPNSRVLDLYAGSGAVGLEAVSRGAERAVLVERNVRALERNVARLAPAPGKVRVLRADAGSGVASLAKEGILFDLVFADPPYGERADVGTGVAGILAADGLFVLQGDSGSRVGEPRGLEHVRREAYGRNVFDFFGHSQGAGRGGPSRVLTTESENASVSGFDRPAPSASKE